MYSEFPNESRPSFPHPSSVVRPTSFPAVTLLSKLRTAAQALPLFFYVLAVALHIPVGEARNFTIVNQCDYMVWPVIKGTLQNSQDNGFSLEKGESKIIDIEGSWNGRIWGRTLCSSARKFTCQTGDCGSGKISCSEGGALPLTLAEFSLQNFEKQDFYDVSLVDGFNLPLTVVPQGGSGPNCTMAGCPVDLNGECPEQLRLMGNKSERIVGCRSACDAFKTSQYCCTNSSSCTVSDYLLFFARACPLAYCYPWDDASSTRVCGGSPAYTITFCPSRAAAPGTAPPLPPPSAPGNRIPSKVIPICIAVFVIVLVLLGAIYYYNAKKKAKKKDDSIFERVDGHDPTVDSLQCGLCVLQAATNNFAAENMIGKGGFGVVYKGTLPSGKHIAIKKLLTRSGKVEEEFKNEMKVVAKLQHRNLVKLLAFCLAGGERLLVFEYVPNKSLDHYLFDVGNQEQLDWPSRFNIIVGIARGLLYLHEDSRLKIIHRDLKPSNILLDLEMNPKIADFGMARIFGRDQTPGSPKHANGTGWQYSGVDRTHQSTSKVGGTLGYMAPEYVQTRRFSVKTDVYSFGVIVLEIISGKRNSTFHRSSLATDLLSYAWTQWKEGTPLELMDARLRDSYSAKEVIRCIHLGLLCVQKDPDARPAMSNVVHIILNISSADTLPMPQLPASFTLDVSDDKSSSASDKLNNTSVNEASITELLPR